QDLAEKPGPTRGLPKVARDAIEHLRSIQKQLDGRQRLVSARALQDGTREKIIAREARRLGVSRRQIRRWWDWGRTLQKHSRSKQKPSTSKTVFRQNPECPISSHPITTAPPANRSAR